MVAGPGLRWLRWLPLFVLLGTVAFSDPGSARADRRPPDSTPPTQYQEPRTPNDPGREGSRLGTIRDNSEDGTVNVIVTRRAGSFGSRESQAARDEILDVYGEGNTVRGLFSHVPGLAMSVSPETYSRMRSDPRLLVEIDELSEPALTESVGLIGGMAAWGGGYTGAGQSIAILDTGVDGTHPMLAGKVVSEACYSTNSAVASSLCPGGAASAVGPGSAAPCTVASNCGHGTHVAGIAAGNGQLRGVAPDAKVIAIQVFSRFQGTTYCGSPSATCVLSFSSDQIRALERVYELRSQFNIAAVNLSLSSGQSASQCDANYSAMKDAIDLLRSANIATIVSSGNNGYTGAVGTPACISTAVSVGSTHDGTAGAQPDTVSSFSNVAPFLTVFAPGQWISSSIPGGGTASWSGTSMAAPHVAGAWALLRQAKPSAGVAELTATIQSTGLPITDTRGGGPVTRPRLRIDAAIVALTGQPLPNPAPVVSTVSPTNAPAGTQSLSVSVSGSGFTQATQAKWNSSARPTTFVSSTQLRVSLSEADLATAGTGQLTVTNPAPGGGTSGPLVFSITATANPQPMMSMLMPASVPARSEAFQLTVTGTGFVEGSVVRWNGADRPTTVVSPTTVVADIAAVDVYLEGTANVTVWSPGPGGGSSMAGTFLVSAPLNPVPVVSALSPLTRTAGSEGFTLTVTGSGFVLGSVVRWGGADRPTTHVSSTELHADISAADIAQEGVVAVAVRNPEPGGGSSEALPFAVTQALNPVPVTSSMSPDSVPAWGESFTLGVTGANFTPASKVLWNGVERPTQYVSAEELRATIPASDIGEPGVAAVVVTTPAPGGGSSQAMPFVITNPVPTITGVATSRGVTDKSTSRELVVKGSGFLASSSVVLGASTVRQPTFVTPTEIRFELTAPETLIPHLVRIRVENPSPGGGKSMAWWIWVN